jgi:hypothetical protein
MKKSTMTTVQDIIRHLAALHSHSIVSGSGRNLKERQLGPRSLTSVSSSVDVMPLVLFVSPIL